MKRTYTPNTLRHDADRRRNILVLLEEAGLLLEELEEMDPEERREAEGHHQRLNEVLEEAREWCGEVGPSPQEREKRIVQRLRALEEENDQPTPAVQ